MPDPNPAEARRDFLRRHLETLRDLPTPSRIIHEIWQVLDDPRASAATLAGVLSRDAALSARTLRLANSAYFGLPNPVADVRAACVVLGFETVRGLAVGVAALDALSAPASRVLDVDAFWRHSIAAATAAKAVARELGIPETGTAFCAGMLHDIGRLVLAVVAPAEYRILLREGGAVGEREREVTAFGASHDEVGGWLSDRWRFPSSLRDAIAGHHAPPAHASRAQWGALVHVSDAIANRVGYACLGPETAPEECAEATNAARMTLGLSPAQLAAVERELGEGTEGIGKLAVATRGRS